MYIVKKKIILKCYVVCSPSFYCKVADGEHAHICIWIVLNNK